MLLDVVAKGTTNYQAIVRVVDSTDGTPETGVAFNTAGVDLWYRRQGGARTAITEVTQTVGGAHADGGFVHVSDGYCRLDLPDAALASGADFVDIGGTFTGMVVIGGRIRLSNVDLDDGVRGGMTALPNAAADAAGGLPISDAGGLDLDSIKTDTAAILVDTGTDLPATLATIDGIVDAILVDTDATIPGLLATIDSIVDAILVDTSTTLDTKLNDIQGSGFATSTDSLEALRNRGDAAWTGSAITSDTGTAQAGAATSITLRSGASAANDTYNGQVVYISAGTGAGQSRAISDYDGTTKVATVISNWATAPDNTSVYDIYPDDITEITSAPSASDIADAVWNENTAGHTAAGSFGEQVKNDIDAILADTNELQSDWVDGGRLDTILDAVLVDTNQIGVAGAGLTAVAWNAAWDAEVQSEVADALAAYDGPTRAELSADIAGLNDPTAAAIATELLNRALATHNTADSVGLVLNELQDGGRLDVLIDDHQGNH